MEYLKSLEEYVVTFKNGETCGMSLIHKVLEENNLDPLKEMENLFENYSDSEDLPESLKLIEKKIDEQLLTITKPLCMMMLQKKVGSIHFSGAITRVKYFQKRFKELVSFERLEQIKNELNPYMKKEYLDMEIPKCKFLCETTGESMMDMYVKQDTEIFLIKSSPLIDTEKIDYISFDNFTKVGIIEFIRFTNLVVCFDNTINTTKLKFYVTLELEQDFLVVNIYFNKGKNHHHHKSEVRIERKGRNERISINDPAQLIFNTVEKEYRTWYGLYYDTMAFISTFSIISLNKKQAKLVLPAQAIKDLQGGRTIKEIPCLAEEDDVDFVKKISNQCVICNNTISHKNPAKISYRRLQNFREVLQNQTIGIGSACNACYKIYRDRMQN